MPTCPKCDKRVSTRKVEDTPEGLKMVYTCKKCDIRFTMRTIGLRRK